jgi:hypothetical protein
MQKYWQIRVKISLIAFNSNHSSMEKYFPVDFYSLSNTESNLFIFGLKFDGSRYLIFL